MTKQEDSRCRDLLAAVDVNSFFESESTAAIYEPHEILQEMHRQSKPPTTAAQCRYKPVDGEQGKLEKVEKSRTVSPKSIIWRISNAAMVVFFLMATIVQINDPDPYIWIPIYLIPAFLCAALVCKPEISENILWKVLCVIHILVTVCGAIYLGVVVGQLMFGQMKNPLIYEEGRELAGLLIVACWMTICRFSGSNAETKRGAAGAFLVLCCVLGLTPLFFWSLCFVDSFHSVLTHCVEMQSAAAAAAAQTALPMSSAKDTAGN